VWLLTDRHRVKQSSLAAVGLSLHARDSLLNALNVSSSSAEL